MNLTFVKTEDMTYSYMPVEKTCLVKLLWIALEFHNFFCLSVCFSIKYYASFILWNFEDESKF